MFTHLKNKFTQAFGGTLVWAVILITIFIKPETISLLYLWKIIGIAFIFSLIFGVVYTYLWEYSTNKASLNILISTVLNIVGGLLSLFLFSEVLFQIAIPYIPYIVILTLIGHCIGFYFYSKYENKKLAKEINNSLNQSE